MTKKSEREKVTSVEDDESDCECCDHSHGDASNQEKTHASHDHVHEHGHQDTHGHIDHHHGPHGHDHAHQSSVGCHDVCGEMPNTLPGPSRDHDHGHQHGHEHNHQHGSGGGHGAHVPHDHHHDHGCGDYEHRHDHGTCDHEHRHDHSSFGHEHHHDHDNCAHEHRHSHEAHDHHHGHELEDECCGSTSSSEKLESSSIPLLNSCCNKSDNCCDHHVSSSNLKSCCSNNEKDRNSACCDNRKSNNNNNEDDCCPSTCCDKNHKGKHKTGQLVASTEIKTVVQVSKTKLKHSDGDSSPEPHETKEQQIIITHATVCQSCDPNSEILHVIQVTRFRVANLCCAGEEKIIREALGKMTGVEHVAVNIVGRYAVVKHCTVDCCAPGQKIVDTLNALHLGVSIHEVGNEDDANGNKEEVVDIYEFAHVLTVAILFLVGLILYLHPPTTGPSKWIFICSIIIGIYPILKSALIAIFIRHSIDINTLIVIAVAGALAAREYFDASLVIAMFLAAELIESVVMVQVRNAIKLSTSSTIPKKAYLIDGRSVTIEELKIGDIIAVRAGEMIVCDGKVVKGEGVVDESSLTGEAVPVSKKVNSQVLSGTVVQNGYLEVETTKNAQDSTLKQLKQAVEDVQADRGEYAKLVDKFASYWTPAILLTTLGLILIGGGATGDWWGYLHRGLVLLILACPCAIVVSAPIPSVCAIATAAKGGVLIKGSTIIEKMCLIDTVAVDKTGTLTKGYFQVQDRFDLVGHTEAGYDPLKLAVALEAKSTHPLANAIVSAYCGCIAEMSDIVLPPVKKVKVVEGVGLEGWVEVEEHDWRHIFVGNERLLKDFGGKLAIHDKDHKRQIHEFMERSHGKSILLVVIDDEVNCLLALNDEVRKEARDFVQTLQDRHHIAVTMLTGDHDAVARIICEEVGLKNIDENLHSRLVPEQKLQWIKDSQAIDHKNVLMIGDGINDSTALACSTVGVAMGAGGTAMAVAAADVVLLNDNLSLLPLAIQLCHLTKNTILQNCIFAISIKILAIILAILGLLEFWHAVLIDIGALLIVVANGTKVLAFTKFNRIQTESQSSSSQSQKELELQESFKSGKNTLTTKLLDNV